MICQKFRIQGLQQDCSPSNQELLDVTSIRRVWAVTSWQGRERQLSPHSKFWAVEKLSENFLPVEIFLSKNAKYGVKKLPFGENLGAKLNLRAPVLPSVGNLQENATFCPTYFF